MTVACKMVRMGHVQRNSLGTNPKVGESVRLLVNTVVMHITGR